MTTTLGELPDLAQRAIGEVRRVIVGQEHMVDQLMVTLVARGHCLIEGVPGVAKTLAVRTFADVVGGTFARIQFTPDLVPSDIVGNRIFRPSKEAFDVELGPVFVNFVIADEVNRAPAKVQSAMLELMGEGQVSIGGQTFPLPDPFIVIATQNPIESEGVYPLPEAQRDRFRMSVDPPTADSLLTPKLVRELREAADRVFVHNLVAEYIVRIVLATRSPQEFGLAGMEQVVAIGASPRATLGLAAAARAVALIQGRDYVLPQDVAAQAGDVIAHRLVMTFDAVADEVDPRQVMERVVQSIPQPRPAWGSHGARPDFS